MKPPYRVPQFKHGWGRGRVFQEVGVPLFGPPDIEKLEQKGDVKGLSKALRHNDDDVRRGAASALGNLGDSRAVDPLIAALNDRNGQVRKAAAKALGNLGVPDAVDPLIGVLVQPGGPDPVKSAARAALESLGAGARATQAMAEARKAQEKREREYADELEAMKQRLEKTFEEEAAQARALAHTSGVIMVSGNYQGCKLVASIDADSGQVCAMEVQFKNAAPRKGLAGSALEAWRPALASQGFAVPDFLVSQGWHGRKPFGATYEVMALLAPGHDVDTCSQNSTSWKDIEP